MMRTINGRRHFLLPRKYRVTANEAGTFRSGRTFACGPSDQGSLPSRCLQRLEANQLQQPEDNSDKFGVRKRYRHCRRCSQLATLAQDAVLGSGARPDSRTETIVWKGCQPQHTIDPMTCEGFPPARDTNDLAIVSGFLIDFMLIIAGIGFVFAELFLDIQSPLCGLVIIGMLVTELYQLRRSH
jgi:hypothetical protein